MFITVTSGAVFANAAKALSVSGGGALVLGEAIINTISGASVTLGVPVTGNNLTLAGAGSITLLNANEQPLAVPSAIDSDGASFDVTRTAAPATTGNGTGRSRRGGGPRP